MCVKHKTTHMEHGANDFNSVMISTIYNGHLNIAKWSKCQGATYFNETMKYATLNGYFHMPR